MEEVLEHTLSVVFLPSARYLDPSLTTDTTGNLVNSHYIISSQSYICDISNPVSIYYHYSESWLLLQLCCPLVGNLLHFVNFKIICQKCAFTLHLYSLSTSVHFPLPYEVTIHIYVLKTRVGLSMKPSTFYA